MYIIMGASGRVGSQIVQELLKHGESVKAVIHDDKKAAKLTDQGAGVAIADAYDLSSLRKAFDGGETLFAITPETGKTGDLIAETQQLLDNYRAAVTGSTIKKVVGLSSMGA